jgi:hypothetical protein
MLVLAVIVPFPFSISHCKSSRFSSSINLKRGPCVSKRDVPAMVTDVAMTPDGDRDIASRSFSCSSSSSSTDEGGETMAIVAIGERRPRIGPFSPITTL